MQKRHLKKLKQKKIFKTVEAEITEIETDKTEIEVEKKNIEEEIQNLENELNDVEERAKKQTRKLKNRTKEKLKAMNRLQVRELLKTGNITSVQMLLNSTINLKILEQ